jgi:hypothetical protein
VAHRVGTRHEPSTFDDDGDARVTCTSDAPSPPVWASIKSPPPPPPPGQGRTASVLPTRVAGPPGVAVQVEIESKL